MVVIYAFDFSSDLHADTGTKAAQLFVAEMNAAGGVDALQAPATVKRAAFLSYAKSLSAAYYISGYMTPLGGGVSLVEQVVDVSTGTIVLGATAQIASFEDAASQAVQLRDGIVQREQGKAQAFDQSSAQATPAPLPSNQANISAGIAGLFKHRPKETPDPRATPIVKPSKGIFVVHVGGSLTAGELSSATAALYAALNHLYDAHMTNANGDASKQANAICGSERNNTVAGGALSSKNVRRGLFGHKQYTFAFAVYTCFGAKLAEASADGDSITSAVNAAVASYATDHPQNS
jgi:TolB-like protein